MEEKLIEIEQERQVVEKKVYTPPTVTIYGKLTELTATGTGQANENKNDPAPQPLRHP